MFHATLIIEDTTIIATGRKRQEDETGPEQVDVLVIDGLSGKRETGVWTHNQLTVVLALAMGMGEEHLAGQMGTRRLYDQMSEWNLFDGWDADVMPVP